ncbi:hypothetical protein RRF57_013157 [Xylaria bambusicola]|uniref:Uncharacterized protein n=1 Tax=Xylaria bambusicola TaxID=326684 RepID=A0AAN7ZBG6_9PEZI
MKCSDICSTQVIAQERQDSHVKRTVQLEHRPYPTTRVHCLTLRLQLGVSASSGRCVNLSETPEWNECCTVAAALSTTALIVRISAHSTGGWEPHTVWIQDPKRIDLDLYQCEIVLTLIR